LHSTPSIPSPVVSPSTADTSTATSPALSVQALSPSLTKATST
jgi:hypothetical protein